MIQELRKDKLFNLLFKQVFHSGSFYDGTKIDSPNEFDLNIVLDLNALGVSYEIVRLEGCPPGYIMIQVEKDSTPKEPEEILKEEITIKKEEEEVIQEQCNSLEDIIEDHQWGQEIFQET